MSETMQPAVAGPVEPTVMQRLYEPWNASLKTKKTNNIGIYNRVGELVATLDVHQCATQATQDRRMREARMMAAAPDLLAALNALMVEVEASGNADAHDFGWQAAVGLSRLAMARAVGAA